MKHFSLSIVIIPIAKKETEDISNIIIQKYQEGVKKYGRDGCIVLSPTHYYKSSNSSPLCTDIMNKKIQDIVNEAEKGKPEWRAKSTKIQERRGCEPRIQKRATA